MDLLQGVETIWMDDADSVEERQEVYSGSAGCPIQPGYMAPTAVDRAAGPYLQAVGLGVCAGKSGAGTQ